MKQALLMFAAILLVSFATTAFKHRGVHQEKVNPDTVVLYLLAPAQNFDNLAQMIMDPDNYNANQRKQAVKWMYDNLRAVQPAPKDSINKTKK